MTKKSRKAWLPLTAERPLDLPLLEPDVLRARSLWSWGLQILTFVIVLGVDWVLTTLDGQSLSFQFGPVTAVGLLALMALVYASLMVRHRWPVQVFAVIWLLTLALDMTGEAQPLMGLLVTLYTVAALCGTRVARHALAAAIVTVTVQSYWTARFVDQQPTVGDFLVPFTFFTVVTVAVWLMGRREHRGQLAALALRREVELTEQSAAAAERQRIARELHDILSHSVSAMMMQAAGARALAASLSRDQPDDKRIGTVQGALDMIEKTGSQSMRELHRLLGILRDHDVDPSNAGGSVLDLSVPGTGGGQTAILDLQELVELSRQSGLTVQLHHSGDDRVLDPSVHAAAYRVVQESMTNALKHAGRGAVVDVFEVWRDDTFQLQIRSRAGHDAARPGTPGSGTGLFGLRERVELVGGRFEAGWVGDEFVTTATLPLTGGSLLLDPSSPRTSARS